MKRVEIINGVYGYKPQGAKFIEPVHAGALCTVTDEEAARLEDLKVAICIGCVEEAAPRVVATGAGDDLSGEPCSDIPREETGADGSQEAHLDAEQLQAMTVVNLKKMAEDMGISTAKLKKKDELIAAIVAMSIDMGEESESDDAEPPDLCAEAPVV